MEFINVHGLQAEELRNYQLVPVPTYFTLHLYASFYHYLGHLGTDYYVLGSESSTLVPPYLNLKCLRQRMKSEPNISEKI